MRNISQLIVFSVFFVLVGGDGQRPLAGIWSDRSGLTRLEFERDGSVVVRTQGTVHRVRYHRSGGEVVLNGRRGSVVLQHEGAARLRGPMGLILERRAELEV
jgi:hypothetical protein